MRKESYCAICGAWIPMRKVIKCKHCGETVCSLHEHAEGVCEMCKFEDEEG